ncbi:hypothetical protein HanIR_Chr13g0668831 [Helianthus annuus]|nr:hypothetical protein HanIR_Chr13g0668831 [Helianthus annuus]
MKLPNCMIDFKLVQPFIFMLSSMGMLALLAVSISFSQPRILSDLSFCPPPPVGKETCVSELQFQISKRSMLCGQQQRSILSQLLTINILRDDRLLPPILSSSSFSPKLTKFEHPNTVNFFIFTRTLLASSSDSHKYLISLHFSILTSSTAPIRSITPLHTS